MCKEVKGRGYLHIRNYRVRHCYTIVSLPFPSSFFNPQPFYEDRDNKRKPKRIRDCIETSDTDGEDASKVDGVVRTSSIPQTYPNRGRGRSLPQDSQIR